MGQRGAALALATLVIASLLFGLYVANFSNYDRTYGSLAGVVVFLLWLLTEEDVEVTLSAERPVVDKETVPVERVRLEPDAGGSPRHRLTSPAGPHAGAE